MKTLPIVVIGHVDHGKTSLVRALTGIETDRLPEEKRRGLSILPGYAFRQFGDVMIDFIDAPGHEGFIRSMAMAASGARAALLVVSAKDGIRAQTREHVEIARHFGIKDIVIAMTQSDLVTEAEQAGLVSALQTALQGGPYEGVTPIFCSAKTGSGLDEVSKALEVLPRQISPQQAPSFSYLPIDRVFSMQGSGTVVTGTLQGGPMHVGDELTLTSRGTSVSVRSIQTRGETVSEAMPGERVALNLRDVDVTDIARSDLLHAVGAFKPSAHCDVRITISDSVRNGLKHMERIRILHGTAQTVATVRLFEGRRLQTGERGFARLAFDTSVTLYAGQHTVLRRLSPAETLGGALVLDPLAPESRRRKAERVRTLGAIEQGDVATIAAALASEASGTSSLSDIARVARQSEDEVRICLSAHASEIAPGVFSPDAMIAQAQDAYLKRLSDYHRSHPIRPAASRAEIADPKVATELTENIETELAKDGRVHLTAQTVVAEGHDPFQNLSAEQKCRMEEMEADILRASLHPPIEQNLLREKDDADLLALLLHAQTALRLHNVSLKQSLIFHQDALVQAEETLRRTYPDGISFKTGEARAALETTRKYVVPLLEYFDKLGVTVRAGDTRYIVSTHDL